MRYGHRAATSFWRRRRLHYPPIGPPPNRPPARRPLRLDAAVGSPLRIAPARVSRCGAKIPIIAFLTDPATVRSNPFPSSPTDHDATPGTGPQRLRRWSRISHPSAATCCMLRVIACPAHTRRFAGRSLRRFARPPVDVGKHTARSERGRTCWPDLSAGELAEVSQWRSKRLREFPWRKTFGPMAARPITSRPATVGNRWPPRCRRSYCVRQGRGADARAPDVLSCRHVGKNAASQWTTRGRDRHPVLPRPNHGRNCGRWHCRGYERGYHRPGGRNALPAEFWGLQPILRGRRQQPESASLAFLSDSSGRARGLTPGPEYAASRDRLAGSPYQWRLTGRFRGDHQGPELAGRRHCCDSTERPLISAHRSPRRERPGSLAMPPFGAAERLTVPDPQRPVSLLQGRRSIRIMLPVDRSQPRESREQPGTLDYRIKSSARSSSDCGS